MKNIPKFSGINIRLTVTVNLYFLRLVFFSTSHEISDSCSSGKNGKSKTTLMHC